MKKIKDLRVKMAASNDNVEQIVEAAVNDATEINLGTFYGYEAMCDKHDNVLIHYNNEDRTEHCDFVNRLVSDLVLQQIKMCIAQKLELKANEFVLINKPKFNNDIYCVLPIYVITPHTEINFGYLKIKRDFGIGSTIVVLNNYKQKTNNNAHRIILG